METSRSRVRKAINHQEPDITPINLEGIYDLARWNKHFETEDRVVLRKKLGLDVQSARPVYFGPHARDGLSIWGTALSGVYGADGVGYGVGRVYPLAEARTVEDVEHYSWPDPGTFDYAVVASVLHSLPGDPAKRLDGKYGIAAEGHTHEELTQSGPWVPLLCTLFDLFGLEATLQNIYLEPKLVEAAVGKIEEFLLEFYGRMLDAAGHEADLVYFGDDFSTQTGLMISPSSWRHFLLPTYRRLFSLVKKHGLRVWMHSCGSFHDVMNDLIDAGLDVWETVQVQATGNDPMSLKRLYGRHITFYGGISTQRTLPYGSEEEVRKEVRERIAVLGEGGGYICGPDHGIMPDVPVENVLAMFDEARKANTGAGR